jgi:hypothetical protein
MKTYKSESSSFPVTGINMTASFFGDTVLSLKQIYKIVDSVFDTMTLISQDSETMSHQECIQGLLQEPLIRNMVNMTLTKSTQRVKFGGVEPPFVKTRLEEESQLSTDVSSVGLTPLNRAKESKSTSSGEKNYSSSDNSSFGLTPLAKVRIHDIESTSTMQVTAAV